MRRCRSLSEPYDPGLSCLLIAYIATGMLFMLLPGTFLGVWNLLTISARHTPTAVEHGFRRTVTRRSSAGSAPSSSASVSTPFRGFG